MSYDNIQAANMHSLHSSTDMNSPQSSDGGASCQDSPATKLTVFSPEGVRLENSVNDGKSTEASRNHANAFETPVLGTQRLLSPTASAFNPPPPRNPMTTVYSDQEAAAIQAMIRMSLNSPPSNVHSFGPIGGPSHRGHASQHADSERRTRSFLIENISKDLSHSVLSGFFSRRQFGSVNGPLLSELSLTGKVYISFDDSRDAQRAVDKVGILYPDWHIVALTPKEYAWQSQTRHAAEISDFEGQIHMCIQKDANSVHLQWDQLLSSLRELAGGCGDVKCFEPIHPNLNDFFEFKVEYFNIRDAENAVRILNDTFVQNSALMVKPYAPDVSQLQPYKRGCELPPASTLEQPSGLGLELSPTGRTVVPIGENASIGWVLNPRKPHYPVHARNNGRFGELRIAPSFVVDMCRIQSGVDVRTTIMLRNIPNKMDQAMLKGIVDETSFGRYDFMYLRIDFENNCNVGYAFINFLDPMDIVAFMQVRVGKTWNCFNSDKIAEVSYATVQGRESLIDKFRNSSVLLENPAYRPKLFFTEGPLTGTEERFPHPNNPSKLRRSVENAERVGLYAPRPSSRHRHEHRSRHSQYDRGTHAAEWESHSTRPNEFRRRPPHGLVQIMQNHPQGTRNWVATQNHVQGPNMS